MNCQKCSQEVLMPFKCPYCGGQYCSFHRLPESHDCPNIALAKERKGIPPQNNPPHTGSYEYTISYGKTRKVNRKFKISSKEAIHLSLAALLVIGIGFSIAFYSNFFSWLGWNWQIVSVFAVLLTASFLIHELAHKFISQKNGLWAEFRLTTWGTMITLISIISPIKLIAPGAVMIAGPARQEEIAKISVAGPLINIVLGFIIAGLANLPIFSIAYVSMFSIVAFINGVIAVFNLIPFGILDGFKIYSWNKKLWSVTFVIALILAVYTWFMAGRYL